MPLYSVVGGKYIIGQLIGKGSFGEVYLTTVEGEDMIYAMKRVLYLIVRKMNRSNNRSYYMKRRF